jgi:hypothetical protein
MEKRAQLSLLFTDDELYDNFIVYQKQNKTLRSLVLRLLTKYYYDEDVRELVDYDGETEDGSEGNAQQNEMLEYFKQCQESLAMMSVYADSLEDLTEDSLEHFGEFTQDLATKTQGKTSEETEFGATVPQLNMSRPKEEQRVAQVEMSAEESQRLDNIERQMESMMSMMQVLLQQGGVSQPQVQAKDFVEQTVQVSQPQPQVVQPAPVSVPVATPTPVAVSQPSVTPPVQEVDEDGFDALLASSGALI